MPEPKDISHKHFVYSLIKSIWRFAASGLLGWAGFILWDANMYTDIFIAPAGLCIMLAGGCLFLAEILGILEEL